MSNGEVDIACVRSTNDAAEILNGIRYWGYKSFRSIDSFFMTFSSSYSATFNHGSFLQCPLHLPLRGLGEDMEFTRHFYRFVYNEMNLVYG